ncbi:flagellar assembly protein FliW [Carboxydothermus ferrireducens]|uniref:Flagellar assembly factor FliW n=1 Tax=Carboxydothermus ferrireducens DSM 11255 TaxID=1119529 RepID=A0ABX2R6U7_9THEO|nr:flagellar assembly protein FliW [Carboxydothermus ferrireducens]NYE56879.1 flagellar assembly factor FliW [Carboxydothermus ferrireducens DSM 11255]
MRFFSPAFGEIEADESQIFSFPEGLPGFSHLKKFLLIRHRENSPFFFLIAVEEPEIYFILIEPSQLLADYHVELSSEQQGLLKLFEETPVLSLNIVRIPPEAQEMIINLKAPVVFNLHEKIARQVILEANYPVRYPISLSKVKEKADAGTK